VTNSFYFVHEPLSGIGSITVSVFTLTEYIPPKLTPEIVPWVKAWLIIKQNTSPGSPYAAIMVTGSHGVRMQDDFVDDTPGLPGPVSSTAVRFGTFPALITVIVIGALFITEEYRDALIRVSLAAGPKRSQVLVAKAIVLGAVTFVAELEEGRKIPRKAAKYFAGETRW
jgi:hypothetical protein